MPSRTILCVHNTYRQPGGEDRCFETETALLERGGHSVVRYLDDNTRITSGVVTGLRATWNGNSYRQLQAVARSRNPDLAHFHNIFPLISPAAYYAVRRQRVPIVQTLHNFRLLCPGAMLLRDGKVCEECIERRSWLPALAHRCYRGSRSATAAVATMLEVHRAAGTWQRLVDVYIAPAEFVKRKFIEAGFPSERIMVKPGTVAPDPGKGEGRGGYALFVGRLSGEKGVQTLTDAWRELPEVPLLVAGQGPLEGMTWPASVTLLGNQPREHVNALMKDARVLIVPSVWYETGPLTILEAFACGLPVIVSDLGCMSERVQHRRTGLLFRPGDAKDLARQVRWAFDHPAELAPMRAAVRREFEEKYSAEQNYRTLMAIYDTAIENNRRGRHASH